MIDVDAWNEYVVLTWLYRSFVLFALAGIYWGIV